MPSVDLSLIGMKKGPVVTEYTWKDVVLYALAVGAGPDDLAYVYEGIPGGLKVLPSFCVIPAFKAWPDFGDIEWPRLLHGEQSITLHQPMPPEGQLVQTSEVVDIFDKGKGAVYHVVVSGALEDGSPLYEAEWVLFYLGAGGFGGDSGPKATPVNPPEGKAPDFEMSWQTADDQAALYRLCGDINPLHIDPKAAESAGFDRPILHGMCTYGFAARAIINGPLNGDHTRFKRMKARFSSVVYPGDTLTTKAWWMGDRYIIEVETAGGPVLKNGEVWVD